MKWESLYNARRTGSNRVDSGANQIRNAYVKDYDRLIFSSAFRRLQNKTQVFPLPGAVFVHNRLTHSLEVASVGRSLGKSVGDAIAERYPAQSEHFREFYKYELPSVIAAGCLAHDIGNPPFGHSGEEAIRIFFRELDGKGKTLFTSLLTENQQRDFTHFEGNANAFRTLTHHYNETMQGGFRLTYTTLASIVKYPCTSAKGFVPSALFTRKSGFFDTEIEIYRAIAESLEIPALDDAQTVFARHPFVYLVEAADDICYRVIDFEDAHRLNIISIEKIKELFLAFFDEGEEYDARVAVESTLNKIKDANQQVQYLRARLISYLVNRVQEVFMQHEEELLSGTLNKPLIDLIPDQEKKLIKTIDAFSYEYIYNHRSVVEIEMAGYNVIGGLLDVFFNAIIDPGNTRSKKVLQLIPQQFEISLTTARFYNDVQSIVDFIAGMTDLYALDLYRKITGIDIPQLR